MPELLTSPEPVIYTLPERFRILPKKGLSGTTLFFIISGILFAAVVGVATWYFTRTLKSPTTSVSGAAPSTPPASAPAVTGPQPAVPIDLETPSSAEQPSAPVASIAPETATVPDEPESAPSVAPTSGKDTDSDNLSDAEEDVFSTNLVQPDTDGDGYLDGHEVLNLYNPAGIAPQRIEDAGLAVRYQNLNFAYQILYPTKWQKDETDTTGRLIKFISTTGESISVSVVDNQNNAPLPDWYKNQNQAADVSALQQVTTKNGLSGFIAPDGLNAYFAGNGVVYVINYNLNDKTGIDYPTVFKMIVASFISS